MGSMSVLRDLLDALSEEWEQRTIYGKLRLPFEVVVVVSVLLFLRPVHHVRSGVQRRDHGQRAAALRLQRHEGHRIMNEHNTENKPTDDELLNSDVDAEDTPIGRTILDRPEVRDVSIHFGHQCVIVLVTFDGWMIPSDFARQYDMHLASASIVDLRSKWRRIFDWGRGRWLQGRFVREGRPSWQTTEGEVSDR